VQRAELAIQSTAEQTAQKSIQHAQQEAGATVRIVF